MNRLKSILSTKAEFINCLKKNKFCRNIKDDGYFLEFDIPDEQFYYIHHKRIPTFISPTEANAIYKQLNGKKLSRVQLDAYMAEQGFSTAKLGGKKIYRNCINSSCL